MTDSEWVWGLIVIPLDARGNELKGKKDRQTEPLETVSDTQAQCPAQLSERPLAGPKARAGR